MSSSLVRCKYKNKNKKKKVLKVLEFNIIYYMYMILSMLSSCMVIFSVNPVHSVFYLILVFILVACIVLMLKIEFIGMIFIIIYVGAIAVLFLFVVMMLNIRIVEKAFNLVKFVPVGLILGFILFFELYSSLKNEIFVYSSVDLILINWVDYFNGKYSIFLFGELLYSYFGYEFIIGGLILLVAMLGTIILTLNHRVSVKRQEVYKQVGRAISIYLYK